uniref:histone acetyltransferase n=1 Tax=Ditylenchus dipsaci TaxID=166011 RepID=A0A915D5C2_9BILA
MQRQLILILHAHKCNEKQKLSSTPVHCALPYCPKMKNVLEHMITCNKGSDCTYYHCRTSRQIITHWKECNIEKCPICLPVKNSKSSKGKPKEQPRGYTISPLSSILKKSPRQIEKEEKDLNELKNTLNEHLVVWKTDESADESSFWENDSMSEKAEKVGDKEEDDHSKTLTNESLLC